MLMPLDTQIQILSVDTGNFYYEDEAALHQRNKYVRMERRKLINGYNYPAPVIDEYDTIPCSEYDEHEKQKKLHHKGTNELLKELEQYGISEKQTNAIFKNYDSSFDLNTVAPSEAVPLIQSYCENMKKIREYAVEAKETKNQLLKILSERTEMNISSGSDKKLRELNESSIRDKDGNIRDDNIISVFESSFTRMIGAKPDELTFDFMVIQVYYFNVIKDLIFNGFMFRGEKYIYFTSSAGQIRTKKCVFVRESVWKKYEKTIMCGLTIDDINAKGGINPNKFLAYAALTNSATNTWKEFDIDKAIVINDFETEVLATYDFIDDTNYSIERKRGKIPITHTDGAGMILPDAFGVEQKNMMIRLPFIKGLVCVFDWQKFIEVNNCSSIIKDIYGIEHDVIAEDIQVIFTESQFKLYKYYKDWNDYKDNFKKYNCIASYTNKEEDRIKNATINYQMLQTLTDITEEEIRTIAGESVDKLNNLTKSVQSVQSALGATIYNTYKTPLQEAVYIYPQLLNDVYIKHKLKSIKDSLVKKYKSGKLQVNGKYTFLIPDFYAACEYWFQHNENPKGLLEDGEVFCWLFRPYDKLDCLRSPHLFFEHCVRKNMAWNENCDRDRIREWFPSDGIYTSCHDSISKVLQFDDH